MQITINGQVYETDNMPKAAQDLVARIVFINTQLETLTVAKNAYENELTNLVNSFKAIEDEPEAS